MLNEFNILKCFYAKVINISSHVLIRVNVRLKLKMTPYELQRDRKPNISYFRVFYSKYFIL